MSYKNAKDVLPRDLLEEVQRYVCGECLYIPQKEEDKRSWGAMTATKKLLRDRNQAIFREYQKGVRVSELADKYFLSVKSIQRIIHERKK
ncbi:MAG: hypothetical protein J1F22_00835 [Lachnospiraceae bacterium]|nr:hypothetical protein [Lachnospiraceae bacterium]